MGEILSHPVKEVATSDPVMIDEGATLRGAARQLWAADVGAGVVVRNERPVGIISERDIVTRLAQDADPDAVTAGEVMTPQMIVAKTHDRVLDAVIDMVERHVRHLPVLDDAERVVGMVSMRDLLRPMLVDTLESEH